MIVGLKYSEVVNTKINDLEMKHSEVYRPEVKY